MKYVVREEPQEAEQVVEFWSEKQPGKIVLKAKRLDIENAVGWSVASITYEHKLYRYYGRGNELGFALDNAGRIQLDK